ncbi:hypothetical protein GOZ78_03280 [Agrobacterium vitis]|uniref:Uncharacterized protein n=1 Tax=Agrobacterium vitis TaxID=373 RepID=A0ABD6GCN1_AGRVI|nr:hypothetical protein [Agrobacterium vitis]MUO77921.1 hypothetical protein [Agrobacterium vitis]MUO93439.1 hypothetical protein [Agrobacterium vitis]MUP04790.1 hypothetical protein [Agrobacterium vitis]MVA09042.1 hypothetical protein [Agrobacterium vitis]MVA93096.1 hypothetical protein [Agrobacterium vitis]
MIRKFEPRRRREILRHDRVSKLIGREKLKNKLSLGFGEITAIVALLASFSSVYLTKQQLSISERALIASSRNAEMAMMLSGLRDVCSDLDQLRGVVFKDRNFVYKSSFISQRPLDGRSPLIFIGKQALFPDLGREEVVSAARELNKKADDVWRRFELVKLYLTEKEIAEADASHLKSPLEDFTVITWGIGSQQISARKAVQQLIAGAIVCETLPSRLAAWFRNSKTNKLGYIFRLEDAVFSWIEEDEYNSDLVWRRGFESSSLEGRDERYKRPGQSHEDD